MLTLVGILLVIAGVLGGFVMAGGQVSALVQPSEFVVLGSAAIGGLLIATPSYTLANVRKKLPKIVSGGLRMEDFQGLLVMQYHVYTKLRKEGLLAIEGELKSPTQSELFRRSPAFVSNHGAVDFYCDALRQILNGVDPATVDLALDADLDSHEREGLQVPAVFSKIGDAMPGLGIVAAVLGIVVTMSHLDAPPEELGKHIAAALVGTFLGVLLAYGFLNPISAKLEALHQEEEQFYACLASGLRAFNRGAPPMVAVELARKSLYHAFRPESEALEAAVRK
jgi:chemotaxis protein MotA